MYPNQDQPGQQQHSQHYSSSSNSGAHPAQQEYPPRQEYQEPYHQHPPPPQPNAMVSMATYPPQADMYRMPSHADPYRPPPQDPYRSQPPQHMPYNQLNQPAPRQRTAIACRYCRRRKIRCTGFESSEDGRCGNCQRFNQECIFTPVSSQAQAFVPAHTAYPHLRNAGGRGRPGYPPSPPVLYGAHGQPLSAMPGAPAGYAQEQGYPLPSPTAGGPSPTAAYARPYEESGDSARRRRPQDEPHSAVLPPSLPGPSSSSASNRLSGRRGSGGEHQFGDYHGRSGSPSSVHSYQSAHYSASQHQTPTHQHPPYYTPTADPRQTPDQAGYTYEQRASHSPHGSTSTGSGGGGGYPFPGLHPPPPQRPSGGTTPSPSEQQQRGESSGRSGMSIQNLLDQGAPGAAGHPGRSARDNEMLDALMPRRGM
ncbi:MAG: hypothetical protein M4579_001549 [Chaenotheca gracillima]|nr:MAG: hypothetical protein M4579_001549 [Chaenotheca gracillima]